MVRVGIAAWLLLAGCAQLFHIDNTTGAKEADDASVAGDALFDGPVVDAVGTDAPCATGSITFVFTGGAQTFTRPSCVTSITVDASGAAGGTGFYTGAIGTGGLGGRVQGTLAIAASDVVTVYVGGVGGNAASGVPGAGGFNGGGSGATLSPQTGGGGGGASDIRLNGVTTANRIFVAAGGGGVAACGGVAHNGGTGGGPTGGISTVCGVSVLASGGTQTAGGTGGTYSGYASGQPGGAGTGGSAGPGTGGAGAGGGLFGGGGGSWTGGAGGSSYATAAATGVVDTPGFQAGVGRVIISY